ncbi:ABC transporter permease subunit [Shigella sonnei]|nr:ABC transporter permease subunit [Shigella sonnei]
MLCVVLLAILADQSTINSEALINSLTMGLVATFIALLLLLLWLNLDGSWTAVVWGHLLWVMPWMLFILQPAWQRIDSRLILIAQTLGWSRAKIFFYVKCPLMLRPVLTAFAVGFSVSIAQYMPTLWLGAGRFPTLTTEAVALSSGGSNGILAAQALWQLLLPLIIFALTALVAKWVGYVRQGIR